MVSIRGKRDDVGFGPLHRDFGNRIERGTGSDRLLHIERRISGNETSNVEEGVGDEYRAIGGNDQLKG
jgi:hypothetical protein